MSWQAVTAARRHRVGSGSWKAILLIIAEHCNPDGVGCTARYQTIADDAECSLATVKRAVPAMLAAGVLSGRVGALGVEMDLPITMTTGVTVTPKRTHREPTVESAPVSPRDQEVSPCDPDGVTVTPPSEPVKNRPSTNHVVKRATPAPDIWAVTDELRAWASTHAPKADITVETANWLDHHRAKGSTFKDWTAAWRQWMRNAQKWDRTPNRTGPRSAITYDRSEPTGRMAL